jgi:hypothetical protein
MKRSISVDEIQIIKLPSGGDAALKAGITNRTRVQFAKVRDDVDKAIEFGIKSLLVRYKDADGTEAAFEALMNSTDGDDFMVISEAIQKTLVPKDPKE